MRASILCPLLGLLLAMSGASERNADLCMACYDLAERIEGKMRETEGRAAERVSIGERLDSNGKAVPKKVLLYGNSEKRLLDVLEGVCDESERKAECNELLYNQDELISTWFYNHPSTPLVNYVCYGKLKGCSADTILEAKASKDIRERPRVDEEQKTFEETVSSGRVQAKQDTLREEKGGKWDFYKTASKLLKDSKIALIAGYHHLYRSLEKFSTFIISAIKNKEWDKLQKTMIDPNFYRGNWLAISIITLGTIVLLASLSTLFTGKAKEQVAASASKRRRKISSKPTGRD